MSILKNLLILFLIVLMASGCEKDNICLEPNTPHLIITFHDIDDNSERKNVLNLNVKIEGIDGDYDPESIPSSTDSISIPVRVDLNMTNYFLTAQTDKDDENSNNEDSFNMTYSREDFFISRSCGYKTLFYQIDPNLLSDSSNWIKKIETVNDPQDILDEESTHIKIYH